MLHVLLAGLVLISGSQTTTTSAARGHVGENGGGTIYHVSVHVEHSSVLPPVTNLRRPVPPISYSLQQRHLAPPLQYCTRWYDFLAPRQIGCAVPPLGLPGVL